MERLIILLLLLLFSGCSTFGVFNTGENSAEFDEGSVGATGEIDTSQFIARAENASCAEILNTMYLIDGEYVIWYVRGNCADASYGTTLYDARTGDALCSAYDSIAGPVTDCNDESNLELFQTLANARDPNALEGHTVEEIYAASGGRGIRGTK